MLKFQQGLQILIFVILFLCIKDCKGKFGDSFTGVSHLAKIFTVAYHYPAEEELEE